MSVANDQLKHEVMINRLATDLLRTKVYPSLDAAYKAVRAILLDAEQIKSPAQLNRITKAINEAVQSQLTDGWTEATSDLTELAIYEASYYANLIGTAAGVELSVPSQKKITDFVKAALMVLGEGDKVKVGAWADFVQQNIEGMALQYNNIVKAGYVNNQTVGQISRSIKLFNEGLAKNQAEALARTGALHYANQAREAMALDNLDIIKRRYYLATFDNRTTLGCRGLHGKTWLMTDDSYIRLPRHFSCRSTYLMLTGDNTEPDGEMPAVGSGSKYPEDADKKPKYKGRKDLGKFDIEQIPADTTPDSWMRGQSEAFIVDSLGATRAKLFLDGKLKIERMSDAFGNPLTLAQLRQLDATAFTRAGL